MVYEDKIYIIGSTGNIGQPLVRKLLSNSKVSLTLYVRTPAKVQQLFGEHPDGKISIVQGDYYDQKPFVETIAGHTRLFILLQLPDFNDYKRIGRDFAEKAYAAGVKQVVLNAGSSSSLPWRYPFYSSVPVEEAILSITDRKAFVTLRPALFMSNQLAPGDAADTVKSINSIVGIRDPDEKTPWVSPNDIGELAANVLQEPIEKHGDAVYEIISDPKTPKEQADILSRVLGKDINYVQITEEQFYETLTKQAGIPHGVAFLLLQLNKYIANKTIGLSVLLGRQPETLEGWIKQNKKFFL
ncbi:hypothetical protein BDA99DRAFT_468240 [Phascolomyces articulosus]|uniref:NmrA-like domain-containing protein n=1 Tax=Phascolomyces articulosus TaxID=60185 RepID=A0AAD5K3F9_9FUNG|nr:hypothetical protein BDA99DRAFT_468240 [Phascolomyces articulosus]